MREIKFRAWHEYGSDDMKKPGMIYDEKPGDCLRYLLQGQKIIDVMQYTGLKDKNGKEIYEDDIVNIKIHKNSDFIDKNVISSGNSVVEWRNASFIVTWGVHQEHSRFNNFHNTTFEVIGNIYENLELLEIGR